MKCDYDEQKAYFPVYQHPMNNIHHDYFSKGFLLSFIMHEMRKAFQFFYARYSSGMRRDLEVTCANLVTWNYGINFTFTPFRSFSLKRLASNDDMKDNLQ